MRFCLTFFLLGAVFGTLGDFVHVATGTTSYPAHQWPMFFLGKLPYWVPLLFGFAVLGMAVSQSFLDQIGNAALPTAKILKKHKVILGLGSIMGSYLLSGFVSHAGGVILLGVAAVWVWWGLDHTLRGLIYGISTSVCGTFVETYLSQQGVFSYRQDLKIVGAVPLWLPILYFIAAIGIGNATRYFKSR